MSLMKGPDTLTSRLTERAVAAVAALGLAATGTTLLPASASAAEKSVWYSCSSPILGEFPMSVAYRFSDGAPYGGLLDLSATLTLPPEVAGSLGGLGIEALDTDLAGRASLGGVPVDFGAYDFRAPVPDSGSMEFSVRGYADTYPTMVDVVQAGDTPDLSLVYADGPDLDLTFGDAADAEPLAVSCELDVYQDVSVGPVTIWQAGVKLYARMTYDDQSHELVTSAVVSPFTTRVQPVGRVRLVLERNGKRIDRARFWFTGERLTLRTPTAGKGSYRLLMRFRGDKNFGTSTGIFSTQL